MKILSIFSLLLLLAHSALAEKSTEKSPFTVPDSIAMTQIIDPDINLSTYLGNSPKFNFSRNGKYFFMVTRKGNLSTGQNDYQLIFFRSKEVLDFVDNRTKISPPEGKVVVRLSSASNSAAIISAKWLSDNETIAFIGKTSPQAITQVYGVNIFTGELRKLTDHPGKIISFDVSLEAEKVIYTARLVGLRESSTTKPYLVGEMNIYEKTQDPEKESSTLQRHQYYVAKFGQRGTALGQSVLSDTEIWISPDGRWAVALPPAKNPPPKWAETYLPFANRVHLRQALTSLKNSTEEPKEIVWLGQLEILNLAEGTVRTIFDAPSGRWIGGNITEVLWLPNSETIILGNTFLPLNGALGEERKHRRQSPATIEYNTKTKKITRIMDHVIPVGEYRAPEMFAGMELAEDGTLTIKSWSGGRQEGSPLADKHFEKRDGKWREIESDFSIQPKAKRLVPSIYESLNSSPEIMGRDNVTGQERIITQLNPQFQEITFGKVEVFNWTDASGSDWQAGLVYPVGYGPGQRYPLVVQTHGFNQNQFLIEGPSLTGAYAAQALANKGIMVLQIPDRGAGLPEEREIHRIGIEGAIDSLDKKGLIDRNKVGLIGFSGSGHYVQHLITFSDYDIAAATIADALSLSFSGYVNFQGITVDGLQYPERLLHGARPWGDRLQDFIAQSPSFHLDRIKTPLRLEEYTGMLSWWDIYTILKRQAKPVEWVVIPDGEHNLIKPNERFIIQQGNVDWFDFWLNGRERTEPFPGTPETKESLEEQYVRWRKLRELQEKSEPAAIEARKAARRRAADRARYEQWLENNPPEGTP